MRCSRAFSKCEQIERFQSILVDEHELCKQVDAVIVVASAQKSAAYGEKVRLAI